MFLILHHIFYVLLCNMEHKDKSMIYKYTGEYFSFPLLLVMKYLKKKKKVSKLASSAKCYLSLADPAGDQCIKMTTFKAKVSMTWEGGIINTQALGCSVFLHTVIRIQ